MYPVHIRMILMLDGRHDVKNLDSYSVIYILFGAVGPDHLSEVMMFLQDLGLVVHWKMIGVLLQLSYPNLEIIENNNARVENRLIAMLHQWLVSGRASKQALVDALQRLR